jgi:hypothetical protein
VPGFLTLKTLSVECFKLLDVGAAYYTATELTLLLLHEASPLECSLGPLLIRHLVLLWISVAKPHLLTQVVLLGRVLRSNCVSQPPLPVTLLRNKVSADD